jgi:hypothetical protein
MIAFARPAHSRPSVPRHAAAPARPDWHAGFLALLPDILRQLRFAFRRLSGERRDDAVQEALANALVAYVRLHEKGKPELAYATPLAQYAVRQIRDGRQVAVRLNVCETLSPYAQRKAGFTVSRLHQRQANENVWSELLVEDPSCTPAELAASRIDFAAWQRRLSPRNRRIAKALASGATTGETARRFQLTPGRISQLRRDLARDWHAFHGERVPLAN